MASDFYGYNPDEFPDTEEKMFGMEMHDAVSLFKSSGNNPETLMLLLDMAWTRGYRAAADLGAPSWMNPYMHPNKAIEQFDRNRKDNLNGH